VILRGFFVFSVLKTRWQTGPRRSRVGTLIVAVQPGLTGVEVLVLSNDHQDDSIEAETT
jgi:hypothetical protein